MNIENSNQVFFKEIQTVKSQWLWGLVLIPIVVLLYGMVQQFIFKKPWGNNPMSDTGLLIVGLIVVAGLPLFVFLNRLEIQVSNYGIYYRYRPFHFQYQRIPKENLLSYQIVHYRPLRDHGGWGIRYGKYGKAYTLSGETGVQLVTIDQKKILLGTLKPEEIHNALDSIQEKH
ncbi:MAG: hypothetical protein GX428_03210 [Candidatus Atribacteria bacterium]|nr:hypothetical protein [Candidatus Atribacteria bacterium]